MTTRIDVDAHVRQDAPIVVSPVTGITASMIVIVMVETEGLVEREVGRIVLGDLLPMTLVGAAGASDLVVVPRRSEIRFADAPRRAVALGSCPPELVPVLARATGRGAIGVREYALRRGERLRVAATVERNGKRCAVRDDLAQVVLEF